MSLPALAHLGHAEQAAVLWLATTDGFKMARCLSPETLRAVHADLVRAGQYRPEETPDDQAVPTQERAVGGPLEPGQ